MKPQPRAWPNAVIHASAGTGKTQQLSNRYLQLVSDGQPAEQILASTFARKAAGEILDRVVVRLAHAALDQPSRDELAGKLERQLDRQACCELLGKLLGDLHRLRIGTLDSFFVQLAGSLTLELGLPTGWQIVDEIDDQQLRLEAIRRMLEAGPSTELSALVHLLFKGEATRSITQQLADLVNGLHEVFCSSDQAAWHRLARPPQLSPDELEHALQILAAWPESDSSWDKVVRADVQRARAQDWMKFISTGVAAKLACGEDVFSRKPIDRELQALYQPLLRHASGVLVGQVIHQTEATYKLLSAFGLEYERLKHARRWLRFDDLPRLLATGLGDGLMEQAGWRLDTSIGHLLLDEFQDTSLAQWQVLRPFAAACCEVPTNRSFFCVGDVKQAIYRWRGGVSQLFDAVLTELPGVEQQSLTTSYRSCQVVIGTVNRTFGDLRTNKALVNYPEVAKRWHDWFGPHSTAKPELTGYAAMSVAPRSADGKKQAACTFEFAAARIAELAAQCPGRSIGVLVRRNQVVARLIHLLRSVHGVIASEEGGNPLTDSPAVQLLVSLVKLADHPGDLAARFHVARSALGPVVGFQDYADDPAAGRLAIALRRRLLDEGYGRTIYDWVKALAAHCGPRDLERLVQFVELGYAFQARAGIRPSDFVRFVEETRVQDPTASPVRVMTVHQAKGLQFDIVVVPELDARLKGQTPEVAIGRSQPLAPIDRICRHVNQGLQSLLPPEFQETFKIWPREAVNESLCVLYVALTRAIHALHMIVSPTPQTEGAFPQTYAGLLRSALAAGRPLEPESTAYEHGDRQWFRHGSVASHAIADEPEPIALRLRPSAAKPRELERRSPSGLEGGNKIRLSEMLKLPGDAIFRRGLLWHAWLEQIEWLDSIRSDASASSDVSAGPTDDGAPDDGAPDDERLRSIARSIAHALDVDSEIRSFRRLLGQADIRQALSRRVYADPRQLGFPAAVTKMLAETPSELRVYRERRFAVRDDERLLNGAIDRLVVWTSRDGRVLAADVVDLKTDRLADAATIDAKVEFYRPQIEAYRSAVSRLYGLDSQHIVSRILFLEPGVVRPI